MDADSHWEKIYKTKAPDAVSWYRPHLDRSLALIESASMDRAARIIDIGGGTTEVAIISLSGIGFSRSGRVAGDELDEAIGQYINRAYNLMVGDVAAEGVAHVGLPLEPG